MRTLVISDLHIGAANGKDLLRRAELRAPLIDALSGVDRLVVLGDGLELREAPHRAAAELAAPFLSEAGAALGPGGELLMLAGNHDHGLVAGWIDARLQTEDSGFLGLAAPIEPPAAGPLAQRIEGLVAPARLRLAYPGAWLRDDVFALHGHYVDLHSTVPTFERLAAGAMARWVVRLPEQGARPDDYEAVLAPIYAFLHQLTQRSDHAAVSAGAGASARAWVAMAGEGRARHPVRAAALGTGYVAAVTALNKLGLGPVDRDLSGAALRRGGLRGPRGSATARHHGAARALRAHAPLGPVAARRSGRVGDGGRIADPEHGLLGLPAALPLRHPERLALLAGHRGPRRGRRPAAAHPAAGRPGSPAAATPAVKQVAWQVTPAPTDSSSTPAVCRACSTSG